MLVLHQLLDEYREQQRAQVDHHSRLQFEYSSLVEGGYRKEDVEVHVVRKSEVRALVVPLVLLLSSLVHSVYLSLGKCLMNAHCSLLCELQTGCFMILLY